MWTEATRDYYEALDRLKSGRSMIVPKGTKITKDAVSLEAGRGRGSIKKSRPGHAELIAALQEAVAEQMKPKFDSQARFNKTKSKAKDLQTELDAALAREMSLVYELFHVRQKLAQLTGENIVPLRRGVRVTES